MLVYKITNTVNDRVYIGITSCSLQKRWREHDTLAQTAQDFGISKKMVLLIKQRKAHVYLTQGL